MIDLLRTMVRLLADFWPVYMGGLIVLLSLLLLARLGTLALHLASGSVFTPRAVGMFLGPFFLALFVLTSLDDLARAIMHPFSCSLATATALSPDLLQDLQQILRYTLYLIYGLMSLRLLGALYQGLQAAAMGTGNSWAVAAWETIAVVVSSLALPFLSVFLARYMSISC